MSTLRQRAPSVAVAAIAAATLTACGGGEEPSSDETRAPSASSATLAGGPYDTPTSLCPHGSDDGDVVEIGVGDGAAVLPAILRGQGAETGVVLLHQSSGGGCGWSGYAQWLDTQGVMTIAPDLCGHGRAVCDDQVAADVAAQVDAAVQVLRERGAERVVLVGASLGGGAAEQGAGTADVDAVVSLSPTTGDNPGLDPIEERASRIEVPYLVIGAEDDESIDIDLLRAAGEAASDGTVEVVEGSDHGYALVTDSALIDATPTDLGESLVEEFIAPE